jgi:hypothetical protein
MTAKAMAQLRTERGGQALFPNGRKKSQSPYRRQPGEFEVRIRPDGRLAVYGPDETMLDAIEAVDPENPSVVLRRKVKAHARNTRPKAASRARRP